MKDSLPAWRYAEAVSAVEDGCVCTPVCLSHVGVVFKWLKLSWNDDAVWRLSVAYIGPKSRTERPRKSNLGTEVAHITRDWDTTFKVKRSRSPVRFTYWAWEPTATSRSARWREVLWHPQREERGGGILGRPPAYTLFKNRIDCFLKIRDILSFFPLYLCWVDILSQTWLKSTNISLPQPSLYT